MLLPVLQDIPTFPYTAWQQAVFVVLLIILVIILLAWQSRETARSQKFQMEQDKRRDDAQAERDRQWRDWMEKQRCLDDARLKAVGESVDGLAMIIKSVAVQIDAHRDEFAIHDARQSRQLSDIAHDIRRKDSGD